MGAWIGAQQEKEVLETNSVTIIPPPPAELMSKLACDAAYCHWTLGDLGDVPTFLCLKKPQKTHLVFNILFL